MDKLKKLFPLSFKHCKNVKSLIFCAFLYLLIEVCAGIVGVLVIQPIISFVIGTLLSPITVIGMALYIFGIVFCATGVGAIIGVPMIIIGFPIMMISNLLTSLTMTVILSFATIYTMVGCTVAVLAYAGVFGEITFPEKNSEKVDEKVDEKAGSKNI